MFRNAKVGDKIWSIRYGVGFITQNVYKACVPLPLEIQFANHKKYFSFDGKEHFNDLYPSLFWDEIKYEIPRKPLKTVKKYIVIIQNNNKFGFVWKGKPENVALFNSEEAALKSNCVDYVVEVEILE